MDTDGTPIVGAEPSEDDPEQRRPGMIATAAAMAAIATMAIAVGLDRDTAEPLPTDPFPEMTTTTARFSVEESSLEWRSAAGLEEATSLRDVVRFDGSWVAVGSTKDGIGVWQLVAPFQWSLFGATATEDLARATSAREVDGRLAITATRDGVRTGGGLLSLGPGGDWSTHDLENPNSARAEVVPTQISLVGDEFLVSGYTIPDLGADEAARRLPSHLADAVAAGDLSLHARPGLYVVTVDPGIEVARYRADELGVDVARPSGGGPIVWSGEDLDSLDPRYAGADQPFIMMQIGDLLVAETQAAIVTSDDGRDWTSLDLSSRRSLMGTWVDEAIVANPDSGALLTWTPGSAETEQLAPTDLIPEGTLYQADGDEAGVVAMGRSPFTNEPDDATRETVVATTADGRIVLTDDRLERHEGGEVVSWVSLHQAEVSLRAEDDPVLVVADDGVPFLTISLGQWLTAMETRDRTRSPADHLHVAHSPDGTVWSVDTWADVSGSHVVAPVPRAFAGDDFFLAVADGGGTDREIGGAFMAYP